MSEAADVEREQMIRERYPVAANPYGRMAIRDLLRLLDAERARANAAPSLCLERSPFLPDSFCVRQKGHEGKHFSSILAEERASSE